MIHCFYMGNIYLCFDTILEGHKVDEAMQHALGSILCEGPTYVFCSRISQAQALRWYSGPYNATFEAVKKVGQAIKAPQFPICEVTRTTDNESDSSKCYCSPSNNELSEGGREKKERMVNAKDKKLKISVPNRKGQKGICMMMLRKQDRECMVKKRGLKSNVMWNDVNHIIMHMS